MGEIVKELNMIDFLGMILPGSLFLLLFGGETELWTGLENYLGGDVAMGAKLLILVLGGYIIGMLLHELGDLAEKLLWFNPLYNPRTYAAISTGFYRTYCLDSHGIGKISGMEKKKCSLAMMFFLPIPFFAIIWFSLFGGKVLLISHIFLLIIFLIAHCGLTVLCPKIIKRFVKTNASKVIISEAEAGDATPPDAWKATLAICRDDAYLLQHSVTAYNEEAGQRNMVRKRNLFDGFRAMARNLFIAVGICRVYSENTGGAMSELLENIKRNRAFEFLLYIALLVLIIRYWHYSFLKFKYCYEDNMTA